MFDKTYHATHPDMMDGTSNGDLRARYLISGLFQPDKVQLDYCHNERMVVGGAAPVTMQLRKLVRDLASSAGPTSPDAAILHPGFLFTRT